jgi:outer membrane protein assembly factor BamE (lipoprotein component of BamABCDE complex)
MSRFVRWLIAASPLIFACAGCATSGGADFSRVVAGKTTKSEVRAMLGAPARAHQYRTEAGETWEYPYYGNYDWRTFWVEFDSGGTVAKTDDTLDFTAGRYRKF